MLPIYLTTVEGPHLSSREVMVVGDDGGVLVQPLLAIFRSIIWQVREIKVARSLNLLRFLFEISGVHDCGSDGKPANQFGHNSNRDGLQSTI